LRVDVHESVSSQESKGEEVAVWGTFRGNEWGNKGEASSVKEVEEGKRIWGFDVKVLGVKEYLVERQGCEFFAYCSTS
jgi:ER membrane protein complex subunit 7